MLIARTLRGQLVATLSLAVAMAVVVACGATPATTQGAPTGEPTDGESPPVVTTPAPPVGGGTDVQDPCALATVEEVAAALGPEIVEAEAITGGDTTYCNYRTADGDVRLAISFTRGQTFVFDAFAGSDDAVPVPGLGDAAVISGGVLYLKQGDAVVGIQPSASAGTAEELIDALRSIGEAMSARL